MRRAEKITIREVAARAGVSVSTVSRVLSGAESPIPIGEETRQRVLQAAKDLSYRPHPGARLMRSKTSPTLGLVLRGAEEPFLAQLARHIRIAARASSYETALAYVEADSDPALRISDLMMALRYCDGLLLAGDLPADEEDIRRLRRMGWNIPVVLVCGGVPLLGESASIAADNHAGAWMALDYLASLGHREIAFLGGGCGGALQERQNAYAEFMQQRFGPPRPRDIQPASNSLEGGRQGMAALLALPQPPTAVFASSDQVAIGALQAAFECEVRVPQDVSLIGFDDIPNAAYTPPGLTTIRQPVDALGQQAVELLEGLMRGERRPTEGGRQIRLATQLIIRKSCQAIG